MVGEASKNETAAPSGISTSSIPRKSGTAVQVQNGVAAPRTAAMTFPGKPGQRAKSLRNLVNDTRCFTKNARVAALNNRMPMKMSKAGKKSNPFHGHAEDKKLIDLPFF
jgi:hypothetical protein